MRFLVDWMMNKAARSRQGLAQVEDATKGYVNESKLQLPSSDVKARFAPAYERKDGHRPVRPSLSFAKAVLPG